MARIVASISLSEEHAKISKKLPNFSHFVQTCLEKYSEDAYWMDADQSSSVDIKMVKEQLLEPLKEHIEDASKIVARLEKIVGIETCSECNHPRKDGVKFCPECGTGFLS